MNSCVDWNGSILKTLLKSTTNHAHSAYVVLSLAINLADHEIDKSISMSLACLLSLA